LEKCINAIRELSISHELIEFIIVDNGSDNKFENRMNFNFPFRFKLIRENRLGLTNARITGIKESVGDLLVFVDDDNVLDRFYLKNTIDIIEQYRGLGCFGAGVINPIYELEPATELLPFVNSLAVRKESSFIISDDYFDYAYPYGAGMIVKRDVALEYVADVQSSDLKLSLDRKGEILNSCGDDHFSWLAIRMGYKKGVFPQLVLNHYITAKRIQKGYLLKLAEGYGFSRSLLFYINGVPFLGLDSIKSNEINNKDVSAFRLKLYLIKRSIKKLLTIQRFSIREEFVNAHNDGVLRFYRDVYLKQVNIKN
jgi:glycosyltransferase involved in cell wall biosynthesis